MSRFCLSLVCAPEIEEKLLDLLLVAVGDEIFISSPTFGHGTAHGRLSSDERVMGRSRSVHVQLLGSEEELASLLETLRHAFSGTRLRYWATPLTLEGEIE